MTNVVDIAQRSPRRPLWVDVTILVCAGIVFVTMVALGNWQMQRLAWKTDLIDAVNARAFGAPVAAPEGPLAEDRHAYLRVTTTGVFRHDDSKRVKALTELGAGHWVLTPFYTGERIIWVNRGFVPTGTPPEAWTRPEGTQEVIGLLRMDEPGGTLLEQNDPAADRWVSRDIAALSARVGIARAAPYFIDAEHAAAPDAWPRGGLTIVQFRNTHLSYALTWYAMALLFAGGMAYVIRDRLRARHGG